MSAALLIGMEESLAILTNVAKRVFGAEPHYSHKFERTIALDNLPILKNTKHENIDDFMSALKGVLEEDCLFKTHASFDNATNKLTVSTSNFMGSIVLPKILDQAFHVEERPTPIPKISRKLSV